MKVNVIGVRRMSGTGKQSKQPYDMMRILTLSQIRPFAREGMSIQGAGFEVVEVGCTEEAYSVCEKLTFPAFLDLDTDMQPRGGKLEPVVVGIQLIKAA